MRIFKDFPYLCNRNYQIIHCIMLRELTHTDKERLSYLHDKIKNHDFRKNPTLDKLREYKELLDTNLLRIIGQWSESGEKYYMYVKDQKFIIDGKEESRGVEVWGNPIIGILNNVQHDYRSINMEFSYSWKRSMESPDVTYKYRLETYREKFYQMSETMLTLIHFLIEDRELAEATFPGERSYSKDTHYEFVKNPKYDNLWTKKWILEHQVMDSEKETTEN